MTIAIPRLDRTTAAERGLTIADFLVPIGIAERIDTRVRHIALVVAGALFILLTAQIYIVRCAGPADRPDLRRAGRGGALGARRGFAAVALYIALGLVGLPFFAEGKGGLAVLVGADRRLPRRVRRRGRRSSAGWPSSAGIAASAARSR